jgi:putative membrane protein
MDRVRFWLLMAVAFAGCQRTEADDPIRSSPPRSTSFSDPQIAAIVVAANQVDIDSDQLALKKTRSAEVRTLAEQMVTDHSALTKEAVELVTRLDVTPQPTEASRGLILRGAAILSNLEVLDADAFDRAYVNNEVEYHKAVIGLLSSKLIPSATHPDLKALLLKAKGILDTHLQHAEQVQAAFSGDGAAHSHHVHPEL